MALDLTLYVAPPGFEQFIAKATAEPEYASYLQFVPHMLSRQSFNTQGDLIMKELAKDVAAAKKRYPPTLKNIVLEDESRVSCTLDHLLTAVAATRGMRCERPLWHGGRRPGADAITGMSPMLLTDAPEVRRLASFFAGTEEKDLYACYDYALLEAAGVYKLTRPDDMECLMVYWRLVKEFFNQTAVHSLPVISMVV